MGGMSGSSLGMLAAVLGGGMLGNLTAPEGQELKSYDGTDVDSAKLMKEFYPQLQSLLKDRMADADAPVRSEVTVNPLPSYVGGGLPTAISAPGVDRRRLEGMTGTAPTTSGGMAYSPTGRRTLPPPGTPPPTGGTPPPAGTPAPPGAPPPAGTPPEGSPPYTQGLMDPQSAEQILAQLRLMGVQ
jgi:hypothetical protein